MWLVLFWAAVIAFAILMYVVLDGFDLGVGILFGTQASEQHRTTMMGAIAPFWDGNETWLVLVAAGLFATFPMVYAIFLPAFYLPVALMLLAIIFRGVAFEFRERSTTMRPVWDWGFILGSLIIAFVQGTAIGAMVQELPVVDGRYAGGAFEWLTPFAIFCGIGAVLGYALHGAAWLVLKTDGELRDWAYQRLPWLLGGVVVVLVIVVVYALATGLHVFARGVPPPLLLVPAVTCSGGDGWSCSRHTPTARRSTIRDGGALGRLLVSDIGGELLALHDPLPRHCRRRGVTAAVARVLFLGWGPGGVSDYTDLHRRRLLDLSRQGGQGCAGVWDLTECPSPHSRNARPGGVS